MLPINNRADLTRTAWNRYMPDFRPSAPSRSVRPVTAVADRWQFRLVVKAQCLQLGRRVARWSDNTQRPLFPMDIAFASAKGMSTKPAGLLLDQYGYPCQIEP